MRSVTFKDIGARVVRGKDWKWGNQDKCGGGVIIGGGVFIEEDRPGWVRVKWDHGGTSSYRIGDYDKYDLFYEDAIGPEKPQFEPLLYDL